MSLIVFIVTDYGCNSTPGDIYTPTSKIFADYNVAYDYFISVSPTIDDDENSIHYINPSYDPNSTNSEYIVIEDRQFQGKRSSGAVIARYGISV
jgi:hypothetical protein